MRNFHVVRFCSTSWNLWTDSLVRCRAETRDRKAESSFPSGSLGFLSSNFIFHLYIAICSTKTISPLKKSWPRSKSWMVTFWQEDFYGKNILSNVRANKSCHCLVGTLTHELMNLWRELENETLLVLLLYIFVTISDKQSKKNFPFWCLKLTIAMYNFRLPWQSQSDKVVLEGRAVFW